MPGPLRPLDACSTLCSISTRKVKETDMSLKRAKRDEMSRVSSYDITLYKELLCMKKRKEIGISEIKYLH